MNIGYLHEWKTSDRARLHITLNYCPEIKTYFLNQYLRVPVTLKCFMQFDRSVQISSHERGLKKKITINTSWCFGFACTEEKMRDGSQSRKFLKFLKFFFLSGEVPSRPFSTCNSNGHGLRNPTLLQWHFNSEFGWSTWLSAASPNILYLPRPRKVVDSLTSS